MELVEQASRGSSRRRRAFTFIEVILALLIIGTALVALSGLISRDMKTTAQNRWDEIAQGAAATRAEYYARYQGFNSLNAELGTQTSITITENQPTTNPPALQDIPWRRIRRVIERYTGYPNYGNNPNPEVLRLTVFVDIAESAAAGAAGNTRTWKAVTLVVSNGFDKSG